MTEGSAILQCINQWDENALRMIYKQHYKMLVGFAMQLLGNLEEAEDVVQDVILNTWQQQNQFHSEGQLRTYLFNAVRNRSLSRLEHLQVALHHQDRIKREYREMQLEENDTIALHKEEVYRQLFLAIDQMPRKQRDIFLLAIEGKQNKEIAEILDININTVKSHKRRGIERLRETLNPEALLLLSLLLP